MPRPYARALAVCRGEACLAPTLTQAHVTDPLQARPGKDAAHILHNPLRNKILRGAAPGAGQLLRHTPGFESGCGLIRPAARGPFALAAWREAR